MPQRKSSRSRSSKSGRQSVAPQKGERLQKILAAAGIASRRDCEELITEGRVMVDGKVVTKLGSRADLATQEIAVDGQKLKQPKHVYYAVHKPKGVLSTNWDPSGRTRLVDLAPDDKRLFCVGRLDRSSEGLALLTNDGDFAHKIMHPSFGVSKTYVVEVAGSVTSKDVDDLTRGVYLSEGRAKASKVRVKSRRSKSTLLEIELQEGKNREIRRIMAKLDHKVVNLKRIAIGPLRLGDMPAGAYRDVNSRELAALRKESSSSSSPQPAKSKGKKPKGTKQTEEAGLELLSTDIEYDEHDGSDSDLVEVRDTSTATGRTSGAVIGGDSAGRPKKSAKKGTRKKASRRKKSSKPSSHGGASARRRPGKKVVKKKSSGGRPKRRKGR